MLPLVASSWLTGGGEARPRWGGYRGRARFRAPAGSLALRGQVQDDHLVGTGAGTVVRPGRLTGLVGVLLGRPAGVVLRVVLEPLRRARGRDDRQVGGYILRDRRQRRGLRRGRRGSGQGGQLG